jgi:hypothetical protein
MHQENLQIGINPDFPSLFDDQVISLQRRKGIRRIPAAGSNPHGEANL